MQVKMGIVSTKPSRAKKTHHIIDINLHEEPWWLICACGDEMHPDLLPTHMKEANQPRPSHASQFIR